MRSFATAGVTFVMCTALGNPLLAADPATQPEPFDYQILAGLMKVF